MQRSFFTAPLGAVACVTGLLVAACGPQQLPPDVGGEPLWEPIDGAASRDRGEPSGPLEENERRQAGPITLNDVSNAAGLGGVSAGGNTHGVGVAFVDVDGDTWADIVLVNGRSNVNELFVPSALLHNNGDGTFENQSVASGLADILAQRDGYSIAAGDLDGDGDIDLYVGAQPTDILLRNRGDGTFEDATAETGAGGPASDPTLVGNGKSKVVSVGDFDNDGHLDLVSASSTLPLPGAYLLRNRGDGTFEDVSASSGVRVDPSGNPCAVMWSDYDTDADRDLWIWNDRGGHILLRNNGDGTLEDATAASRLDAVTVTHPMGIDAADIDLDGDLDFYISNIGNNPLLRNNGDGTFVDITERAGTGGQYGWGLGFEDLDLDGRVDMFVAQEDDRPELVFRNEGGTPPTFERIEVPHDPVLSETAAHNVAVAFADYDHDGRVDVLTARTDGSRLTLYRNETDVGTQNWIQISIAADGPRAVGSRIAIAIDDPDAEDGERILFRDISGGSSRASQNELGVRFGIGHREGVRWVGALLPTGEQDLVRNVGGGQRIELSPR